MDHCSLWKSITHQFRESCLGFDHVWIKRRRVFDTFSLTTSLLDLVAGSERSYLNVMDRFHQDGELVPAASSFCTARTKLPAYVLEEINHDLFDSMTEITEPCDWFGLTPFAIDGSKFNLPRRLISDGYPLAKGCYYPSGLVTGLVRISDRALRSIRISKHHNERQAAHELLDELEQTDLLVYDRGYLSFALLLDHVSRGIPALFRVASGNVFEGFEEASQDPRQDLIVTIDPSEVTYRSAKAQCPELVLGPIELRVIKYEVKGKSYMLATTLLDQGIPAKAFRDLYPKRWRIEEFYKSDKQTMKGELFHAQTENGIEQEVFAAGILWNLSRTADLLSQPFKKNRKAVQKHHTIKSTSGRRCSIAHRGFTSFFRRSPARSSPSWSASPNISFERNKLSAPGALLSEDQENLRANGLQRFALLKSRRGDPRAAHVRFRS